MVGEPVSKTLPGSGQGIEELVIRIIHLVDAEDLFQASLIEFGIVGHQRKALDHGSDLFPYLWEDGRILGVFRSQAVDLAAEPLVVFRFGMNQAIERIDDKATSDNDHTHTANAAALLIGGLEIYGSKVGHRAIRFYFSFFNRYSCQISAIMIIGPAIRINQSEKSGLNPFPERRS